MSILSKKTILVTGAEGQLGKEFFELKDIFPDYRFLFAGRNELDITDKKSIADFFKTSEIHFCINCAAYTAVDKAEGEKEIARRINSEAAGNLAAAAKQNGAVFFHISTDYVFKGTGKSPYLPDDKTDPVNYYGFTKREGEKNITMQNPGAIIIRTAWLYSSYGNNFVKTMIRLMKEKEQIGIVDDQKGSPTYAADLAAALMKIIESQKISPGTYHYTNAGTTTWYGFAKEIARLIKSSCIIEPISTHQYPTPAARPTYSVLDAEKIKNHFKIDIPDWQSSLQKCIAKITAL